MWRRLMLRPFASTIRRAEISSPSASTTRWRSSLVEISDDLGMEDRHVRRDLRAHGVDEGVVHHAVLVAGLFRYHVAETRFPDFAVDGRRA